MVKGGIGLFLMVPLTTYYLEPKDFGIAAVIGMLTGLITPLSSTGISWVLSIHFYKTDERERGILFFNILFLDVSIRLFWGFIFWITAPHILPWIITDFETEYLLYFHLSLLGVLLSGLWPSISFVLTLKESAKEFAFVELIQQMVGISIAVVCLVILKLTTVTLFVIPIAAGLVSSLWGLWFVRAEISPQISKRWIYEVFHRGMPTIPVNLFESLCNSLDKYFIQRWVTLSQLGYYSHSQSYRSLMIMVSKAFTRTFVPRALQVYSHDDSTATIEKSLRLWYGLLGISAVFVILFSRYIIDILTHGKFIAAAPLVPLWFMITFSLAYGLPYSQYLYVHKQTRFLFYSSIITNSFSLGMIAFLIFKFGILGAVTGAVMSHFLVQVVNRIYSGKLGCEPIAENDFIFIVCFVLTLYIVCIFLHFGFFARGVTFLLLSIFIAQRFGFIRLLKVHLARNSHLMSLGWRNKR
jgi:O-antigen/teichoic acid export membrane protein